MAGLIGKTGKRREFPGLPGAGGNRETPLGGISRFPSPQVTTAALVALADRLRRLSPSPRNPDRFHEEKSEIEHALRRLAMEMR